ncbi:MAG: hypothetical protein QUV04_06165 [Synechococcus sp. WH 8007]|nr:hypothetical protein [Synechococcus sp. WH 8007]
MPFFFRRSYCEDKALLTHLAMKTFALAAACSLLVGSGLTLNANAMEPIQLSTALPTADHGLMAEQAYMEDASARHSVEVADDALLPLEFKKPSGPQGYNVLNLSF